MAITGVIRLALCIAALAAAAGVGAAETMDAHAIEGRWAGTSLCTNLAVAPHCKDESVRYTFAPGGNSAEPTHLVAEKIVAGKYEVMYEMDFLFDAASASWRHDFTAANDRYRWSYRLVGGRLLGETRELATGAQVRSVVVDRLPAGR